LAVVLTSSHAGFDPSLEVGMDMGIALLYAQVTL